MQREVEGHGQVRVALFLCCCADHPHSYRILHCNPLQGRHLLYLSRRALFRAVVPSTVSQTTTPLASVLHVVTSRQPWDQSLSCPKSMFSGTSKGMIAGNKHGCMPHPRRQGQPAGPSVAHAARCSALWRSTWWTTRRASPACSLRSTMCHGRHTIACTW